MIVLAESNFVLELALRQEQFEHAERILRLAEKKDLRLVVPACSLMEPYQTLVRRQRERKELSRRLQDEIKLLERSALHAGMSAASHHVAQVLDVGTEAERESLEQTIDVFASIDGALQELGAGAKVFVNKNSKDFATPLIEGRLEKHECRLITSFQSAANTSRTK